MENYAELMFHDAVADLQKRDGSFDKYQTLYPHRTLSELGENEKAFIQARESIYVATVNPDGWPYVQHRGGPRGFLKVLGPNRIACADYRGNRQFISMGNIQENTRVSLFCMDYMNSARLKIQGNATLKLAKDADPQIFAQVQTPDLAAERVLVIDVVALDWNCPKYIPRLFTEDAIRQVVGSQMGQLQAENSALREELARLKAGAGAN